MYFGRSGSKGQPWLHVFGGWGKGRSTTQLTQPGYVPYDEERNKYDGWNVGGGVGYSHFLNKRIALQYYLDYRYSYLRTRLGPDYKNGYKEREQAFYFGLGLQIHLKE